MDDFSITPGTCPPTPNDCLVKCNKNGTCIPSSKVCDFNWDCPNGDDETICGYNCDFENSICNYTDPSAGDYKWKRQRGATPGSNTGPTFDHTTLSSSGWYMYVDAANGSIDDRAHLISPVFQQSSSTCELTFFYHMFGQNIGQLEVLSIEGIQMSRLWSLTGDQGNRWKKAVVKIGRLVKPFVILIDAKKTSNTYGDIAIDDILYSGCDLIQTNMTCTDEQFQCKRGGCVGISRLCDYTDDCGDMSDENNSTCSNTHTMEGCNFERDSCKVMEMPFNDLLWQRARGAQLTSFYAPQRDHTTNSLSGYYLYVDTTGQQGNQYSRLNSRSFESLDNCTVRLYYYVNGINPGMLSVIVRSENGGPYTYLWSTSKIIGFHWERQEVRIPKGALFELILEVKTLNGGGTNGFIAVDDLSFSSQCVGGTPSLPFGTQPNGTTTSPKPCTYRCDDGTCIGQEKVRLERCDFINDCRNGEDEVNCGPCDFEQSQCGWNDDSTGYYVWAKRKASAITLMPADLTTNLTNGSVMTVASGAGTYAGSSRLVSERIASTAASCEVMFGFYRNRDTDGTLALYLEGDTGSPTKLWAADSITGRFWRPITVSIGRRRTGFRLVFISTHVGSTSVASDISIDDVKLHDCQIAAPGSCEAIPDPFQCTINKNCISKDNLCDYSDDCGDNTDELECETYVEMCSFEVSTNKMCGWTDDYDADYQWKRLRGDDLFTDWYDFEWSIYGPDRDHTLGTSKGYFLFLETSAPHKPNDTARVISPVFAPTTDGSCQFRFWYHMYGVDINALNIYTRTTVGGPMTLRWSKSGSKGDEWLRAKVGLMSPESFEVLIEGVRGLSYEGEIGVDDTSFTPGCRLQSQVTLPPHSYSTTASPYCNSTHSHCEIGKQCIPKDQFCNFNIECTDQTDEKPCPQACVFDGKTLCLWENDRKAERRWEFGSGKTPSIDTGPNTDHTTLSTDGNYIYLETSDGITGHKARLISPLYRKSSKTCAFTFWYHMFGETVNTLNILIRAGTSDSLLWTLSGNQGNEWNAARVSLPQCASEFRIIVEGIRGTSYTGDIALDDFRFEDCYEKKPTSCGLLPGNAFTCNSGHCVPNSNKCDFGLDCCDGTDEDPNICYDYNRCDFEESLGMWEPTAETQLNWERYRVDSRPFQARPPYDHTKQSHLGHILQVRTNSTIARGTKALISTVMGIPSSGCTLRFWYYFKGDNGGTLSVYYRYAIGDVFQSLITLTDATAYCKTNETCRWERVQVQLDALKEPSEITIGVTTGPNQDSIMALDDITFTPQCAKYNGTRPIVTTRTTGSTTTTVHDPTATTRTQGPTVTISTQGPLDCSNYCLNGGICKPAQNTNNKPTCQCKPNYTGDRCDRKKPSKSNAGVIAGSIIGALVVIGIVAFVLLYVRPKLKRNEHTRLVEPLLTTTSIMNPAFESITGATNNDRSGTSDA
ncbi:unnamed protein product [Didymodactylos carnosus]|uniref:Uncharacterized protein n=1 Tax=Didymodactylos carnosus TaxID=1234261 RepID=A0A814K4K9_9BILA|nr:unnamed protein product [Didymodactylos carnosus]CAF3816574.1 unnamed protein product [Didymodactylos carnosus]